MMEQAQPGGGSTLFAPARRASNGLVTSRAYLRTAGSSTSDCTRPGTFTVSVIHDFAFASPMGRATQPNSEGGALSTIFFSTLVLLEREVVAQQRQAHILLLFQVLAHILFHGLERGAKSLQLRLAVHGGLQRLEGLVQELQHGGERHVVCTHLRRRRNLRRQEGEDELLLVLMVEVHVMQAEGVGARLSPGLLTAY